MKTTDGEVRQQVYSEMSAQEKYDLWKKHFQYVKDSHAVGGDAEKRKLVQELENALSVDIFVDESNAQSVFLEYTGPQWMAKAKLVLSDEEIYDVTMENAVLRTPPADDIGQLPKCFCHVGNSGYSCKKLSLSFPWGATIEYGICENNGPCRYSRRGCGFLWLESCDGAHCNF